MRHLLVLFTALLLGTAGCATTPMSGSTTLPITLPDRTAPPVQPPRAPDETRVTGGTVVNLQVTGGTATTGGVVVSFAEPVLRRGNGPWLYTARLNPGANRFTVRPHGDGLCHAPAGCRFVIIQTGSPHRRSAINTPVIIIDPQQMH